MTHDVTLSALRRFYQEARPAIEAGRDEVTARFPKTTKNSSGYALDHFLASGDVLDLIIGSEGTLGIVTRVEVELERRPGSASALLLALSDLSLLPVIVEELLGFDPVAIELLDHTFLALAAPRLPFSPAGIELVLLAEFERPDAEGAATVVRAAAARVGDRCVRCEPAVSEAARKRLWSVRQAASPALAALPPSRRSLQIIEDGCVPVPALGRYLAGVRKAAARHGVAVVAFGHAGDGHLHVNALADTTQPDFERRLAGLLQEVTALIHDLGGTPSGEHGDGRLRAPLLERVYGERVAGLFAEVKRAFDPRGVLNPGVIVPLPGQKPVTDLKVGAAAHPIPEAVEEALREIERTGGWDRPKDAIAREQRATA